jgi:hypothetical protein
LAAAIVPSPEEAMRAIEAQLAHVWVARTFLKHSDEAENDDELQEVYRALYDYHLAIGPAWNDQDAATYLKLAQKKYAKLRAAVETFVRIQPEVSTHTNFQMASRSLQAATDEIGRVLTALKVNATDSP